MNTIYFNLRISEEMNDKIAYIAQQEERSKNRQIEYILKKYIQQYEKENGIIETDKENNG